MILSSVFLAALFGMLLIVAWVSRGRLESLITYVAGFFMGGDIQSRVALSTAVSTDILRSVDGDLITFVRIRGGRRLIGPEDFDHMAEKLWQAMAIKLRDGTGNQHAFITGYLSDPFGTPFQIQEMMRGAIATARRMGADKRAMPWFKARMDLLNGLCNDEMVVLAIVTLRSGLNQKESERYAQWLETTREQVQNENSGAKGKPRQGKPTEDSGQPYSSNAAADGRFNQPLHPVYPVLLSRHTALVRDFLSTIENEKGGISIIVDPLEGDEALYCLRRFVDGGKIPPSWRPALFGKTPMVGSTLRRDDDMANALPLSIARQLFTEPMREHFEGFEVVQREGIWYGSLKLDVCPHEDPVSSFSDFASKLGNEFPYSLTFEVTANGMKQKQMDQMFASFFGGFGSHNRALRDAWRELKEMGDRGGEYVATLRMVSTTRAPDLNTLGDQISTLKMALQGWGGLTVSNESGAPANLLLASAPGLARSNPAPYLPGPLSTFSRMLPLYRAASPWDQGQLLLRTETGKPYPILFGGTNQAFWGTVVFAPPGRGKSFLMNCLNAGLLLSPGLSDLPYITIIDKGMSSANVIEMARGILPPNRQHQALSIRLRNTVEFAINIFDTQLGLDYPTERERDFQVNMVSALCPNLGPEGVNYVGQVVGAAYRGTSRASLQAKRWQRALDPALTERLLENGYRIVEGEEPRVWDIVDALFDLGDAHAAIQAQRFAVPTLDDLIAAANSKAVQDLYGETPTPTGEKITQVFIRSITTAARDYALISTYTRYDIGDARVVSIDLEEVLASASSEESRRRAQIMMLFARQLGARNYFLKWEEMEKIVPERYRKYQSSRVKNIWETLKFLEYDEFHNAHGMLDVQRMVEQDFREGRKYNVVPLLSSQLFKDFSKDLVETTTNFFILGVGSAEAAKEIQQTFELSDAERRAILNDCLGPGPKGAPLFAMFKTDKGTVSQLLFNSASPMEMWAFNSSALDVAVRKSVIERLDGDYWRAINGLSSTFPKGTARFEIERVRQNMGSNESADEDGITATVARRAAEKIQEMPLEIA